VSKSTNDLHAALAALDRPRIEELFGAAVRRDGAMRAIEDLLVPALIQLGEEWDRDRKSTRLNSSHNSESRMPSSA
jgi:hypothetical protein